MKNQLRQHLKFTMKNRLRLFKAKQRLSYCGKAVWIDKNVELMRFPQNISIQNNVVIKEGTKICACNQKALVSIGENTTIGYHNFIFASAGVTIGENCLIAPFVYIVDSNHQAKKGVLINQQGNISEEIIIGNDVWIASNVTILKGVTIGDGAIVAANSVVNKSVLPNTVVGGSPAKFISDRT